MKINFPALFQTPLQKYTFFLLFGNDQTIFERSISFLQKKLALPLSLQSENDLLTNPLSPPSLFEEQRQASLTLVSPVTDKIVTLLDQLKEGHFIFVSEKARAQSKLVTHFSQAPSCLAIASYASPLTPAEFDCHSEGLNLSSSFKNLLFKAYQNDYVGLLAALQKIKLYGPVPEDQVENFLQNPSVSEELAPLIHSFLTRDGKKATTLFPRLSSADMIPFMRTLSRSFQTLFELMPFKNTPDPWQKLTSPVFFKEKPFFEAALMKWRQDEVVALLEALLRFEQKVKSSTLTYPHLRQGLLRFLSR